ncbi:MAG: FecR domain-containing protein [Chitinophagaceae bacterium]|nr:FecR domain-containing protein [Chitinophagaceae bacterium]
MEERIQYLLRQYLDNTCTKQEFDELFACLEQMDDHSPQREQLLQVLLDQPSAQTPFRAYKRLPAWLMPIAASVLLLAGAAAWVYFSPKENTQPATKPLAFQPVLKKSTQRSESTYLVLPDSTQVWLNAASTLEFPENFGEGKREVVLKGEAYFDVKHADKIPFIIYTGKVSTVVLGTAFNIKAYPDLEKITVMVKRGKVKVSYDNQAVAMLTKGQQVSINNTDHAIREKKLREEETNTWQDGNLNYDEYIMQDILADLERVYNVQIKMEDPTLRQFRISTAFKREQGLETALEILCKLTDTHVKFEKGIYIIQ